MSVTTEPEALAALKPILSAIAESGKIEAVDWHNIRRAICDGEAAMRERAAQIADAEMVDTFEDSPEVDCICNSVVREIAKSIRAISTPAARMLAGEGEADKALVERLQSATRDELIDIAVTLNRGVRHAKRSKLAHPPAAEPVGLREDKYSAGYSAGSIAASNQHVWMQDKAWQDAVLMLVHYRTLADRTWLVGHEDAAAKLAEWWKRAAALAETKTAGEIAALATPARTDDAGVGGEKRHTVDIIREWLMSSDHPVSQWERDFAAALDSALSPAPDRGEGE